MKVFSYHTKMRLRKVLQVLGILALTGLVIWICWLVWLQRYVLRLGRRSKNFFKVRWFIGS